jgi:serine/threonine-protein kinase RsbW
MVLDWTLESSADEVKRVQLMVDELNDALALEHETYNNVLVATSEAVNNAILHGNHNDPLKAVKLRAELADNNWLIVTVQDEGKGFDPSSLPDPTQPGHLLKVSGRGIFLMRHLAQEMRYSDNGRRVQLLFRLGR